ncbi:hypothetical protein DFJ77DRAFT_509970 [Powellomyces hirtus]|nr:hypothetical protein DFJ77DRAFT_509970 [Powellomyces hirtus]
MATESSPTLPQLRSDKGTSVIAANRSPAFSRQCLQGDDSDVEDIAGPALAAEDMGLDLDEELEQTIFGNEIASGLARHWHHKKGDPKKKHMPAPRQRPSQQQNAQPTASHEWALKVNELEHENSRMRAELLVKSQEVKALRQEALEQSLGLSDDLKTDPEARNGAREAKIIELAKKARRLNVALERERSQNTVLTNRLKHIQVESRAMRSEPATETTSAKSLAEIRALKDKVAQATRKLEDERIASQTLRTELRSLHQVLRKEIGEDVPLSQILDASSGWKGRAQQIITLKAKIQTLLTQNQSARKSDTPVPATTYDTTHRNAIRRIENDRKAAMEAAVGELEETRRSVEEVKRKYDAVVARNRLLERDIKQHKRDIETLMRKASTDDRLVAALHTQIDKLKNTDNVMTDREPGDCVQCRAAAMRESTESLPLRSDQSHQRGDQFPLDDDLEETRTSSAPALPQMASAATLAALRLENDSLFSIRKLLETKLLEANARVAGLTTELARERRAVAVAVKQAHGRGTGQSNLSISDEASRQLEEQLAMIQDENAALRMTLSTTQDTTQKEIDIFHSLLERTREGFQKDMAVIAAHVQKQLAQT